MHRYLVTLVVLLFADEIIISPNADLTPKAEVTVEQLNQDLDLLIKIAAAGYAGPDLGQIVQDLRGTLHKPLGSLAFCKLLENAFAKVNDAHLHARLVVNKCSEPRPAGAVGRNLRAGQDGWALRTVGSSVPTPVLAIPGLPISKSSLWDGFLEAMRQLKDANKPFILDMRGNLGGDSSMVAEMARILYGDSHFPSPVEVIVHRETPEAFALSANWWAFKILQLVGQGDPVPRSYYDWRETNLRWMKMAQTGRYPAVRREVIPPVQLHNQNVFSAPLYILVDRMCASSCELAIQYLEALPHRFLVGERTMGAIEYGDVGYLQLPNSNVLVELATMASKFRDGRRLEKIGYEPDIRVPPGQDALSVLLSNHL